MSRPLAPNPSTQVTTSAPTSTPNEGFDEYDMQRESGGSTAAGAPGVARPTTSLPRPEITASSAAAPLLPPGTSSRMDIWRNLLTDFMWSMGSGLAARRAGQPGSGMGEALLGPWALEEKRLKRQQEEMEMKLRLAQEERTRVAAMEAMSRIEAREAKLPAEVELLIQRGLAQAAGAQRTQAQTVTEQQRPAQIQAQTAQTQAQTVTEGARPALVEAQTATERERPAQVRAQTAVAERTAALPAPIDPWSEEALQRKLVLAREQARLGVGRGGSSMFERLGEDKYYEMLRESAKARQGITDDSVNQYVEGIAQGTVTNLSQVPQSVRGEVLAKLGNIMIISPTDRDAIRKMDSAEYILGRLEAYSKAVHEDPTDIEAVATLNGLRSAVGGIFAKGVFAETGVLTDKDISRVQVLIPGITRSVFMPGTSERQFAELRGIIAKAKQNLRRPPGQTSGQAKPVATTPTTTTTKPPVGGPVDYILKDGRVIPAK